LLKINALFSLWNVETIIVLQKRILSNIDEKAGKYHIGQCGHIVGADNQGRGFVDCTKVREAVQGRRAQKEQVTISW